MQKIVLKLKELLSNNPLIITIAFPALIIMLYLGLFFRPQIRKVFLLSPQVSQLHAQVGNVKKEWMQIDSIKQNISRLKKKIDDYEKKLPGEKEIPAILEYLSDSAGRLNVRITKIKPIAQKEDKESIYYSVPILLEAECGYHQLGRFLSELESADRFIKISDFKIEAQAAKGNILSVQLIVLTYVMGQK